MPLSGPYGPCLKAAHRRKSSKGLLRKRRQTGSIPTAKFGLKNAGENAMPDRTPLPVGPAGSTPAPVLIRKCDFLTERTHLDLAMNALTYRSIRL